MLFKRQFHAGIRDGTIRLTFRRWARPQVRSGGRYRTAAGMLEVDAVTRVRVGDIGLAEARRSGFSDLAALRSALAGGRGELKTDDEVFRIVFRYLGPVPEDPRAGQVKLPAEEAAALIARLERMDRLSRRGAWTRRTLELIREHPRTRAAELAERAGADGGGVETRVFKVDVRKLKRLGLTRSFEIGYELTPRGAALLRRWQAG